MSGSPWLEIRDELVAYGFDPEPAFAERLEVYLHLLLRWNQKSNLTALREPREIFRTLFAESIFASRLLDERDSPILDVGSGAGFPGMVLALHRPERRIYLVDSRKKKAAFLTAVRRELGLTGVTVLQKRLESCDVTDLKEAPRLITMRAIREPLNIVRKAVPWLAPHYKFLFFLSSGQKDQLTTEMPGQALRSYSIPWQPNHWVLIGER